MDVECLQKLNKIEYERKHSGSSSMDEENSIKNSSWISHKSFLEQFLNQIKSNQHYLLVNKPNIKSIKQYLKTMESNLQNCEKDKITYEKYLMNEIQFKKTDVQNKLFNKEKQINYLNEIEQLKFLSFKIENEIQQIDYEFKKKINSILNLKITRFYQEEAQEFVIQSKQNKSTATSLMKKNLEKYQKNLISMIRKNLNNNLKIKRINQKIKETKIDLENIKKNIHNAYLFTNNTINEEINYNYNDKTSSENSSDNEEDVDNNKKRNSVYKHSSINSKCENLDINFDEISEQIKNKMMRSLSNKLVKRKIVKFINNNLNLNVKLNLNFNNIKIINSNTNTDKNKAKVDI